MSIDGINSKRADVNKLQQAGIHKSNFKDDDQKMKSLFDAMDTDGDGVINQEELKNFTGIDKNNDGTIKRSEARKFLKEHKNLKELGIKKRDVIEFLNKAGIVADGIEDFSGDKENGYTVDYKNSDTKKTIDKNGNYSNYDESGNFKTYDVNGQLLSSTVIDKETNTTATTTFVDGDETKIDKEIIKKNDGTETITIKYQNNHPASKEVVRGTTVETYKYINGEEVKISVIENKGIPAKESRTEFKYNDDGSYTAFMTQAGTNTTATINYNSEGKRLDETKVVNGKEYKAEYDGKGNTKGVVLQKGETIEQLADKFGCSVKDLQQLNGKEKFSAGDEITVKGEIEADDEKLISRKSSEEAKAEYKAEQEAEAERKAKIAAQKKAEAAKRAAQAPRKDEAKRAETAKVDIEGNKKLFAKGKKQNVGGQQLVVKGSRNDGHGRMIAVNAKGEEIIFAPNPKQKDYSKAVILSNDFISASDNADKCAKNGYKGLAKAAFAPNVYYSRSANGKLYAFVMGKDGKVARPINANECLDKDAKVITAKLDKAARDDDHWYSLGLGLGTDEKGLADANKLIRTPEQLSRINNYYAKKFPNWKKDGYKSPYEAFLGSEIKNREVYETMATTVKNGAIKDQARRNEIIKTNTTTYGNNRANMQAGLSAVTTKEDYEGLKATAKEYMAQNPDKKKAVKGQSDVNAMIYHQSEGNADHIRAANTALIQSKEEDVIPQEDIDRTMTEQSYHYAKAGNFDRAIAGLNKEELAKLDEMLEENGEPKLENSDLSVSDRAKLVVEGHTKATPQERVKMAYQLATENKEGNLLQAAQLLQTPEEYEVFMKLCEKSPKLQYNHTETMNYIKQQVSSQMSLKSETSIYSDEQIAQNKAYVAELRTQLEAAKANIQQALAQEGAIDDMINGMREHTVGMGMTRENLEQMLRQADNELKRLDAAAEGKLINKAGTHVTFESLLQSTTAESQQKVDGGLQDYQEAQTATKDAALDIVITLGTMGTGGVILKGTQMAAKGVRALSAMKKAETVVSTAKKAETVISTAEKATFAQKAVTTAKNVTGAAARVATTGTEAAGWVAAKDYVNAATSDAGITMERASEIETKFVNNALINSLSMGAGYGVGKATTAFAQKAPQISESVVKYLAGKGVDVAKNGEAIAQIIQKGVKVTSTGADFGGQVATDIVLNDVVLDHNMTTEEYGMEIGGYIFGQLMARGHVHAPEVKPQGAETPTLSKAVKHQASPDAPAGIAHNSDVHIKTGKKAQEIGSEVDNAVKKSNDGSELAQVHNELDGISNRDVRRANQQKIKEKMETLTPEEQAKFQKELRQHSQEEVDHIFERHNELKESDMRTLSEYIDNTTNPAELETLRKNIKTKEYSHGGVTDSYKSLYKKIDAQEAKLKQLRAKEADLATSRKDVEAFMNDKSKGITNEQHTQTMEYINKVQTETDLNNLEIAMRGKGMTGAQKKALNKAIEAKRAEIKGETKQTTSTETQEVTTPKAETPKNDAPKTEPKTEQEVVTQKTTAKGNPIDNMDKTMRENGFVSEGQAIINGETIHSYLNRKTGEQIEIRFDKDGNIIERKSNAKTGAQADVNSKPAAEHSSVEEYWSSLEQNDFVKLYNEKIDMWQAGREGKKYKDKSVSMSEINQEIAEMKAFMKSKGFQTESADSFGRIKIKEEIETNNIKSKSNNDEVEVLDAEVEIIAVETPKTPAQKTVESISTKHPELKENLETIVQNSKKELIPADVVEISKYLRKYPEYATEITQVCKNNPNISGRTMNNIDEFVNILEQNKKYKKEITEYLSVQRRAINDTSNPCEELRSYEKLLKENESKKEVITKLAQNPNFGVLDIDTCLHMAGNNPEKTDIILKLADKKYPMKSIAKKMQTIEKYPKLKDTILSDAPSYKLIDDSNVITAETANIRANTLKSIEKDFSKELNTLKTTLGEDFYKNVKWEEIIPANATKQEIKSIIDDLNDSSKFFARLSRNEQMYGKNIQWAHEINASSISAQTKIKSGADFKDVIGGIAEDYRAMDVSTTLDSNIKKSDRRLYSGIYRGNKALGQPRTGFNEGYGYGEFYFDKFKKVANVKRQSPYPDVALTQIEINKAGKGTMWHPTGETIGNSMQHMNEKYDELKPLFEKVNSGKELSKEEINFAHGKISEIYFLMANSMPWARGSNGISDVFMRSTYKALGIDQPALKRNVSLDLEAFCVDMNEYNKKWLTFFEAA